MEFVILLLIGAALFVATQLAAKKPNVKDAAPPTNGDFGFPTATEGRPVPIVVGTVRINGPNLVWSGNMRLIPITQNVSVSVFSSEAVVTGYKIFLGMQLALCEGPIDDVLSLWWGDTKVYDQTVDGPPTSDPIPEFSVTRFGQLLGGDKGGNGGISGDVEILKGAKDQPVSPYLQLFQVANAGTLRTPTYQGTACLVFKQFYVGNSASSLPAVGAEVRRIPNPLGLDDATAKLNGNNDANPANWLVELLTDRSHGKGYSFSDLDLDSFKSAAATLAAEGNGISLLIDRVFKIEDLIQDCERQINGMLRRNSSTGLVELKLFRNDYVIADLPVITKQTNIVAGDPKSWRPMAWTDTSNFVLVGFSNRAKDYQDDYAPAQDMANAQIRGGGTVDTTLASSATTTYPGVKDAALANKLAWRDLRSVSRPRTGGTFELHRSMWFLQEGDVVAFQDPVLAPQKIPLRISRKTRNATKDATVTIEVLDDGPGNYAAAGAIPPPTLWVAPGNDLAPFNTCLAIEAPRAIAVRQPQFADAVSDDPIFFYVAAQSQSLETGYRLDLKSEDVYWTDSGVYTFALSGTLKADLLQTWATADDPNTGNPTTLTIACPDDIIQQTIIQRFAQTRSDTNIGTGIWNALLIEDEFCLFRSVAAGSGHDVVVTGIWRGVMDTVQAPFHPSGSRVWFLGPGGAISLSDVLGGFSYEVRLVPFNHKIVVNRFLVPPIFVNGQFRTKAPYPPARVALGPSGGVLDADKVGLESSGSNETFGFVGNLTRRDYRGGNEVAMLDHDGSYFYGDFPSKNNTQYTVSLYNDPLGVNTLLLTLAATGNPSFNFLRDDILKATGGYLPERLCVDVDTQHDIDGNTRHALQRFRWVFEPTSTLQGQFAFGALSPSPTVSNTFTADATGTYSFSLYSALTTGLVQKSVNGGAFSTLINSAATTGSVSLNAGDTLVIRHTGATSGNKRFLAMAAPAGGTSGFALLYVP